MAAIKLLSIAIECCILISRRHAVHAERDIVIAFLSVRPSVCPSVYVSITGIVSKRMDVVKLFNDLVGHHSLSRKRYEIGS